MNQLIQNELYIWKNNNNLIKEPYSQIKLFKKVMKIVLSKSLHLLYLKELSLKVYYFLLLIILI